MCAAKTVFTDTLSVERDPFSAKNHTL